MCITLLFTDSPFKVLIATSKLVSKILESTFVFARTKYESGIVNCISPMIAAELCQELDKENFASVTTDASNRKEQGHDRGIAPALSQEGQRGWRCLSIKVS